MRVDSQALKKIEIFRDCGDVPLQIMAFSADRESFSSGYDIIVQGQRARAAFVILSGQAKIKMNDLNIAIAEAGAILGEVAMLGDRYYNITATAFSRVETARIPRELFMRVAREYPEFGRKVMQNLGDRLATHMNELQDIRALLNSSRNFSDL